MIAIQFRKSIPRYLAIKSFGRRWPGLSTGAASLIGLRDIAPPQLPTPRWVRVRPILSGICGSDIATIAAKGSVYLSPLTSTPFVLGHEVVGRAVEVGADVRRVAVGDRVVLQPALGCEVRGISPPCDACAEGQIALCRNVTRGEISAGIQTGYCRDTGGAWSEGFVAHESQLHRVPDSLPDAVAVLVEPFACVLHAVCAAEIAQPSTVLVLGCGSIGLLTIAAIRAMGCAARIVAVAKHPHQKQHARALGADEIVSHARDANRLYRDLAASLGAELHQPEIGKPTVVGGADVVFDCVASSASLDDSCRFTRAGGRMMLVGMPAIPSGIDWTSIWYKELTVRAAYAYCVESIGGRKVSTFELAIEKLGGRGENLRPLVGEPFALANYREAIRAAMNVGASRSVKSVFRIESGSK